MNDLWTPDAETEARFKAQVGAILAGGDLQSKKIIDMGRMPIVYNEIGITDTELKTNTFTILKALGLKGSHIHNVPKEVLENLLTLVHDPEAVFKSLPSADNPDAYVAVLNAQTKDGKPIVAILSPSVDGKGYTLIPSVYERNNFERFIINVQNDNKVLYVKEKGSELWGRPQSPPLHNSEPTHIILTKEDIVKRYVNLAKKPAPAFNGANIIHKENSMEKEFKEQLYDLQAGLEKADMPMAELSIYADKETRDKILSEIVVEDNWVNGMFPGMPDNPERGPLTIGVDANGASPVPIVQAIAERYKCNIQLEYGSESPEYNQNVAFEYKDGKVVTTEGKVLDREAERQKFNRAPVAATPELSGKSPAATPAEKAFLTAVHQRKVVADALKAGTLSCLPGADGFADTVPAVNVAGVNRYHGANLLQLKEFQKQNGFPTAEFVTQADAQKSGIPIRQGQHGVDITFNAKNEAGQWENKTVKLFNVAQSVQPDKLREWGTAQIEQNRPQKGFYDNGTTPYGMAYAHYDNMKANKPKSEVSPLSTEPEKYLGAYFTAVQQNAKFKPSPEQAAEFSKKLNASLFERGANGYTDPFKLSKICNAASEYTRNLGKQIFVAEFKNPERSTQQERTQSRGRSM